MSKMGLIGYPLGHSFSKNFYESKFEKEKIEHVQYDLYPIEDITQFPALFKNDIEFKGFNVTIPHKQSVLNYLDELSPEAKQIQAVNCITISWKDGKAYLTGYNTDAHGFYESIKPLIQAHHTKALVLGNGGAAKAVFYSLERLGISYKTVSRNKSTGDLTYQDLTPEIMKEFKVIINCSPVGTFPNVDQAPDIPYQELTKEQLLYD